VEEYQGAYEKQPPYHKPFQTFQPDFENEMKRKCRLTDKKMKNHQKAFNNDGKINFSL